MRRGQSPARTSDVGETADLGPHIAPLVQLVDLRLELALLAPHAFEELGLILEVLRGHRGWRSVRTVGPHELVAQGRRDPPHRACESHARY